MTPRHAIPTTRGAPIIGSPPIIRKRKSIRSGFNTEGSGFELLSACTGNVLRLSGTPFFSADGTRFVVIDNDYAHGGPDDLAVGSNTNGALSLEWQQESKDGPLEWHLQRWIDNDHIALRVFKADTGQKCPDNDCDAMLVRFQNSWALRRLPAKQQ
jgi:hypothetical protein